MTLVGPIAYFTRVYSQYIKATQNLTWLDSTSLTRLSDLSAEQSISMISLDGHGSQQRVISFEDHDSAVSKAIDDTRG